MKWGRVLSLRTSADVDGLSRYEAGLVAAEKRDHVRYVLRLPDPAERDLRGGADLEGLKVDAHPLRGRARHARLHKSRGDSVDVDVERAQLYGQRPRHPLQAGFGRR